MAGEAYKSLISKIYSALFGKGRSKSVRIHVTLYKQSAQSGFAQYAVITPPNPHVAKAISVLRKSDAYGVTVELSQLSSKTENDTDSDKLDRERKVQRH